MRQVGMVKPDVKAHRIIENKHRYDKQKNPVKKKPASPIFCFQETVQMTCKNNNQKSINCVKLHKLKIEGVNGQK